MAATASAAVIYTDVIPDQVIEQRTFRIDPDGDGNPDIQFNHDLGCVGNCLSFADVGGLNGEVLLSQTSPDAFITPLAGGSVIGPASTTFGASGRFAEDRFSSVPPVTFFEAGLWDNGRTAFLGFRFLIGGANHYGWARVNIEETSNIITLLDFAYESTANTAITTPQQVPEPATMTLLTLGAAAAWGRAARRRRST
jgi:PEP-CTERM motif